MAKLLEARLPKCVAAGMRHRLARLSESARQLAVAAAPLGRGFTTGELASMMGAPAAYLARLAYNLVQAGRPREADEQLEQARL